MMWECLISLIQSDLKYDESSRGMVDFILFILYLKVKLKSLLSSLIPLIPFIPQIPVKYSPSSTRLPHGPPLLQ